MRKLAILCGGFAFGSAVAISLVPGMWLLPVAVVCFAMAMAITPWNSKWRRHGVLVLCALSLAMGHLWLYNTLWVTPGEQIVGTELYDVVMTVEDYPTQTTYGSRVEVTLKLDTGQTVRAMYYGYGDIAQATPQGTIVDTVSVQSARVMDDTEITTFSSQDIFLLLYSRGDGLYCPPEGTVFSPLVLGQAIKNRIAQCFSAPYDGVMVALITGDKTGLTDEISTDLTQAGLYHILAVSGMHCGFLMLLVLWIVGRQRVRLAALIGIPVLVCFGLLVGASPSVVRACCMMSVLLLAPVCNRQGDSITALALALAVILLENPYAIYSASLQMSFAAVAGIVWVTPKVYALLTPQEKPGKLWRLIAMSLAVTVGVSVFTAPISFWYFGTFWLVSPISNLLCVVVAGWAFITGVLTLLASVIWLPVGLALASIPTLFIRYILWVCNLLGRLPYHAIYDVNPYFYPWLLLSYGLFVVAWQWGGRRRSVYLATAMSGLTLVVIMALGRWTLTCNTVDGFAVDVGQGQCVVLESEGITAVVDCGSGNSWISAGDAAADVLQTLGCYHLEYLVLSHYDQDHISGVEILLHRMEVGTLYVPTLDTESTMGQSLLEAAVLAGTTVVAVDTVIALPFGAGDFVIYPAVSEQSSNDSGITAHCKTGQWDVLITGDLGSSAEQTLVDTYPMVDVDVWLVGHHGSETSSSQTFLNTITPEHAIISVGDNSYGHPTIGVLHRLQAVGAMVYRTDLQGTIHFSAN